MSDTKAMTCAEFPLEHAREIAKLGTPGQLTTHLIRACNEIDRLRKERDPTGALTNEIDFLRRRVAVLDAENAVLRERDRLAREWLKVDDDESVLVIGDAIFRHDCPAREAYRAAVEKETT